MAKISPADSTPQKRGRGRPKKSDIPVLSEDILQVALQHFSHKGFDGTSVREICVELEVSHNLVNDRFGSKDALWRATVDYWVSPIVAGINKVVIKASPTAEPVEVLRAIIVRFMELNAERPEVLRLVSIEGSVQGDRLDYFWDNHFLPFYEILSSYYHAVEGQGLIHTYPPAMLFFLLAHGATALTANAVLAKKIMQVDVEYGGACSKEIKKLDPADPKQIAINAEFVANLLLTPPH